MKRINCAVAETEYFIYDSIDRLVIVAGAYEQVYTYDTIGNITSMNGEAYTYSTKPHAVTAVGAASYIYDGNGNMTNRNGQTITWDVENRPVAIDTESYIYDGDGNRISKTAGGETTLYINRYYETNVTELVSGKYR